VGTTGGFKRRPPQTATQRRSSSRKNRDIALLRK
jgi:hypothetical protein